MTDRPSENAPSPAPPDGGGGGTAPTRDAVLQPDRAALPLDAAGLETKLVAAQAATTVASPAGAAEEIGVLTDEMTEGSDSLDGATIRRDITEGKNGVPLDLRLVGNDPAPSGRRRSSSSAGAPPRARPRHGSTRR